ncbi:MAG: rhodanese-like domain-containing protein [Candidatus Methanofastidiosia archaeon]
MKISKRQMFFKFIRMFLYRVRKRRWYLPAVSEITVDDLLDRINSNLPPLIIDVRDRKEFDGAEGAYRAYGHIPNARSIPIMELASNFEDLHSFKEKEIVTICPGGGMSLIAVEIMAEAGFKDVKSLTGGMDLWHKKGYPTTTS